MEHNVWIHVALTATQIALVALWWWRCDHRESVTRQQSHSPRNMAERRHYRAPRIIARTEEEEADLESRHDIN